MANKRIDVFKQVDMRATRVVDGMSTPCWPWKGKLAANGRPYFTVDGKKHLAYRLTYELATGDELGDKVARHKCDNKVCCRPDHIEPGDHQDNMNDMKARERHGQSAHVVRAIRKLAEQGRPHQEIADLYGIGRSTVTEIVGGVNYSHVTKKEDEDG